MRARVARARALASVLASLLLVSEARELDPAACGARFDVQRDKIIRTEESREMGARYLSELDVGARHECLRLCCETDSCDVFVYEEKSPGSCYLFNCGPPEDFRCKFTAHGNFSSGVLALSRRLAELQDQERLSRHEHELASLRGASTTTTTTTGAPPPPPPPPQAPQPPDPPRRCSHYQFECRRGGECIAVYNACDGVPQCADGSDEAPELRCPGAAPAAAPAPAPPPAPQTAPLPAAIVTHAPAPTLAAIVPATPVKPMQVLGESAEAEVEAAEAERWPHRLTQAQPPRRYNGPEAGEAAAMRGPHIFSHKGGLLQEGAPPAQYAPFEPPWARRLWEQPPVAEWGPAGGAWSEPDPRRAWPVPPPRETELGVYLPAKTMPELPPSYAGPRPALRDGPKKGPALPPPPPPPAPAAPPTDNATKKKALEHVEQPHAPSAGAAGPAMGGPAVAVVAAGAGGPAGAGGALVAGGELDGLSDRPPAAILLLVLGMAMTAVLGGVAWSRARAARRRLRRGKSSLAHDADYLVNGMYL